MMSNLPASRGDTIYDGDVPELRMADPQQTATSNSSGGSSSCRCPRSSRAIAFYLVAGIASVAGLAVTVGRWQVATDNLMELEAEEHQQPKAVQNQQASITAAAAATPAVSLSATPAVSLSSPLVASSSKPTLTSTAPRQSKASHLPAMALQMNFGGWQNSYQCQACVSVCRCGNNNDDPACYSCGGERVPECRFLGGSCASYMSDLRGTHRDERASAWRSAAEELVNGRRMLELSEGGWRDAGLARRRLGVWSWFKKHRQQIEDALEQAECIAKGVAAGPAWVVSWGTCEVKLLGEKAISHVVHHLG